MVWNNDSYGKVLKSNDISEIKLYKPSHSWNMKLSQLARQRAKLIILTYSTNDSEYDAVQKIFQKRPRNILFICHSKFERSARNIAAQFPEIEVYIHDKLHTKLVAYAPDTVYIGSDNFLDSSWHDCTVGIRSKKAYNWCVREIVEPILNNAKLITG